MGDAVTVTCPKCGKRLRCPGSAAGKTGKCSACGAPVEIPAAEGRFPNPVAGTQQTSLLTKVVMVWGGGGIALLVTVGIVVKIIEGSGVRCDRFEVDAKIVKGTLPAIGDQPGIPYAHLFLPIDTDLPRDTVLMVSVGRSYRDARDGKTYSLTYLSKSGLLGYWRGAQPIELDDRALLERYEKARALGVRGDIEPGSLSDEIEVSVVVHTNQKNPAFGSGNENLHGAAVPEAGMKVIHREKRLAHPLTRPFVYRNLANPRKLEVGKEYALSRETPLMSAFRPSDPLRALGRSKRIPAKSTIKIAEAKSRSGTPWYRVTAKSWLGADLGSGWINSIALTGQEIEEIQEKQRE